MHAHVKSGIRHLTYIIKIENSSVKNKTKTKRKSSIQVDSIGYFKFIKIN